MEPGDCVVARLSAGKRVRATTCAIALLLCTIVPAFPGPAYAQSLVTLTQSNTEDQDIPDQGSLANSFDFATDSRTGFRAIHTVSVVVNISHAFREDLRIFLMTPSNEIVTLLSAEGEDDFFEFKELSYTPENTPLLRGLIGDSVVGRWTLRIEDFGGGDIGTLHEWRLTFTVGEAIDPEASPASEFLSGLTGTVEEARGRNNAIKATPMAFGTVRINCTTVTLFMEQLGTDGNFGTFSIDVEGAWTYTLDNENPATEALWRGPGSTNPTATEIFPIAASCIDDLDGNTISSGIGNIVITVNGGNDAPQFESILPAEQVSGTTRDFRVAFSDQDISAGDKLDLLGMVRILDGGITFFSMPVRVSRAGNNPTVWEFSYTAPTVTANSEVTMFIPQAVDAQDTSSGELTRQIIILSASLAFATDASIEGQVYVGGLPIPDLVLPEADSGVGDKIYILTRPGGAPLPDWLNFSSVTRTISGTAPDLAQAAETYIYTVRDSDTPPNTDQLTFDITVVADTAPSFGGASIAAQDYITGTEIEVMLPSAAGGNGALAYTLTPALPAGLRFDGSTDPPTLGGTPSTVQTTTAYTYTASDADANTEFSDIATLTFTIAVAEDVVPSFGGATIAAQDYITGTEINVTLPAAAGGNGALAYTLTPALPAGLTFDGSTDPPTLGGTPSTVQTTTAYTYTASDADANTEFSDVATLTFTIAVAEDVVPSFGGASIAAQEYITGTEINVPLPSAAGGNGALAYTLTPTLPAGLRFDGSTDPPTLGGTPSTVQTTTAYTYTASDTDANTEFSDVATLTFTIAVAEDVVPSFGGASIAAQDYITGTEINVTLPSAAGGNGALEYTLTPTLPAGLTFDGSTDPPTLGGTPSTVQTTTAYTYTASDADANTEFSDVATLAFTIAVAEDVVPSFGGASIAAQEYITGTEINVTLPAAVGGNGALAYTLTPALPAGLRFDPNVDPPTLGGTPLTAQAATTYTYTASDADTNTEFSDVATLTFTLAVAEDVVPSFGGATIAAQEYITGTEINVTLPAAAGGNGALAYTLTPALPAGLTFDPNVDPPTLGGTPSTAQTTTAYTYTASDADANTEFSDVATLTFTIAVAEDVVPSFGGASIAAQEYITGTAINVTLPAAVGGNGALAYTLTPALPAGLRFDPNVDPPTLSGTPLTAQSATTYTYTASDADANTEFSDVATLTFTIAVAEDVVPSFGGASIAAQDYITGTAIEIMLPAAAGGNGALAYTLTPTLPAGLTFDGSTDPPTLGGTPLTAQAATAYTYTASDADANTEFSDVATLTFTIAVAEDVVPSFGGASIAAQDYITGTEINVTLPAAAGGNGALAYTLTPALPAGLTFDGSTDPPTLGGTPSTAQTTTAYTYTASDTDANTEFSDVATLTFTIAVAEDVVPSFGGATIAAQEYITGTAINVTLPAAVGGNGALAYTLTPALPAGLRFDPNVDPPTLGGTPSTVQTTTAYTYTASDTDANTEFSDVATLTFTIAVAEDVVPSFGGASIAAQEYITGTEIEVMLPSAAGGNGALAYTLTPALPAGLTFDPNVDPPTLGGTPSTAQAATTYTYTASDADANTEFSDAATLTFTIAVAEDVVPSFGGATIAAQDYITGTEINVTLPAAVGGNGALAYTLTPALPAGLTFDPNVDPPALGGTPLTVQTTTAYTYTASDADANTEFSDVATLTFTIAVAEDVVPSFGGASIAAQEYITGTEINVTLPAAAGGNGALAYTLTPALPAGLTFDPNVDPPTLGGTPSTAQTTTAYTYTASDADANTEFSDAATLTFTIAVAEDVVPSFGGASIAAQEYITGTEINVMLPAAAGGNGALAYTLTPALPAGLTFDPNVDPPTLGGTPSTAQTTTAYTYTASDTDANTEFSDVATLTFTIAVAEDVVPSFGGASIAAQEYITGTAINVTLPAAVGGNGALAYTLTPALPAGLRFDPNVDPPTLSGTPLTAQSATTYTYTASDADANTEFSDVATLTFTIAVAEDVVPSFGGASIAAQDYITGTAIEIVMLHRRLRAATGRLLTR